jgi:hypothetical protein
LIAHNVGERFPADAITLREMLPVLIPSPRRACRGYPPLLIPLLTAACVIGPIEVLSVDSAPEIVSGGPASSGSVVTLERDPTKFWVQVRDENPEQLAYLWELSRDGPLAISQESDSNNPAIGGSEIELPRDANLDGQVLTVLILDENSQVQVSWTIEVIE